MVSSYRGHLKEPVREQYPHVGEFMSRSFLQVTPDTDVYQTMGSVLQKQVSGALVVNDENQLVGIISEKDLLKLATQDTYTANPHGGPVSAYMTTQVVSISPEQGLNEAAHIFLNNPYKKLPVLENGKVIGVVRRRDVLQVIEEFYKKRMRFLRDK